MVKLKSMGRYRKIQGAAERIFAKKGYYDATMTDIAREANVGEATIYNHFKTKEELLVSIPMERTKEAAELLARDLQGIDNALERIPKIIWFFFDFWESHPDFSAIIQLMWRVNKKYFHLDPDDLRHSLLGHITETIEQGKREGTVDPKLTTRLCRDLILGIMESMLTRWLLKHSEWSLRDNAEEVAEVVIRAICMPRIQDSVINVHIEKVNIYGGKGEGEGGLNKD